MIQISFNINCIDFKWYHPGVMPDAPGVQYINPS